MSNERFKCGETSLFEWIEDNGEIISTKECVKILNEQDQIIRNQSKMYEDAEIQNEQLRKQLQNIEQIIQNKINRSEEYLQQSIKGGMPTGGLYSELEFLKVLEHELEESSAFIIEQRKENKKLAVKLEQQDALLDEIEKILKKRIK